MTPHQTGACVIAVYTLYFADTKATEASTLSLHDALPISDAEAIAEKEQADAAYYRRLMREVAAALLLGVPLMLYGLVRSEEHTSELQSRPHLVCRLLLEKKNKTKTAVQKPPLWKVILLND